MAGERLRSVMSSTIRRRRGLTADAVTAKGWSPGKSVVSAISANNDASPASAGSFNRQRFSFYQKGLDLEDRMIRFGVRGTMSKTAAGLALLAAG